MIDNSISMADKQEILADAVPVLVQRLITPACVDPNEMQRGRHPRTCRRLVRRLASLPSSRSRFKNIHIGIITSSLGDHGSHDVCSKEQNDANVAAGDMPSDYNDVAQLCSRSVRPAANASRSCSWNGSGFLVWDPRDYKQVPVGDQHMPAPGPNETVPATFITNFKNQVVAASEHGCGYEASLEAWYRFLVDPEPVNTMDNDEAEQRSP